MRQRSIGALVALGTGLVMVGVVAAASKESTRIDACRQTKTGAVRIVPTGASCASGESRISWSAKGPKGDKGSHGDRGPAGVRGAIGKSGARGPVGGPGPRGATGAAGPAGPTGAAGPAGPTGGTGPTGAVGPTGAGGPTGASGPTGATGATGAAGPVGAMGPVGPAGAKGTTGVEGPRGATGADGPAGPGLGKLDDLEGLPCTRADASSGVTTLTVDDAGIVTIRCEAGIAPPPPPPPPPPPATGGLVINEVDYDQVGADSGGFVEIANTSAEVRDLSKVALVLVNGDGSEYGRVALSGTLAAGGYLRVDVEAQNGAPDGLALVDTEADALLDALSYEGPIGAAVIGGHTFDLVEGTMLPVTVADSNTVNGSLARSPDRSDTDNAAVDWVFTTTPTPGAANVLTTA